MGSEVMCRNRATAPKGQQNLAQGFNPGLITAKRCALKVAPDRLRPGYLAAESSVRIPSGTARKALRPRRRRRPRPRPRIRPRGVMEYWSVGVLRQFGIAPRVRGVGNGFRAHSVGAIYPGLKPWAQFYRPFLALSSRPVLDLSPVTFHLSHSSP
jgi:hypothetical protein